MSSAPNAEAKAIQLTILLMALVLPRAALADSTAGIKWTAPSGWKQDAPRPMRVATYSIPAAKGDPEPAECAVFYFGAGQGGSIDANVQRWVAQFETADGKPLGSPVAKKGKINKLPVTRLDLEGTYLASTGPMAPTPVKRPGYKLMGAIVEAPDGPVFFKLTGPAKTVAAAKADFEKLLSSLSR
jgi:hypothetical protein